jgi:hypothetical protein
VQVVDLGLPAEESVTGAALLAKAQGTRFIIATSRAIRAFDLP